MSSATSTMKRVGFFLPLQVLDKLRALSITKGVTVSEVIRRILDDYFIANPLE